MERQTAHKRENLTIQEAAAFLGLPISQLESWALRGIGPDFKGNALRPYLTEWPVDALAEWKSDATAQPYGELNNSSAGNHGSTATTD